jgi:putative flippase GtrA
VFLRKAGYLEIRPKFFGFMLNKLSGLKNLMYQNSRVVWRYSLIGVLGTAIDFIGLYVLVQFFYFPVLLASAISFLVAVINNFVLNKNWTFQYKSQNKLQSNRKLFIKFLLVSVVGLLINLAGMFVLTFVLNLWYIFSKVLITGLVFIWNFLANKLWTFRTVIKV